jgi:hypothetical protein
MRFSWLEMVDLLRAAAGHRGGRAELHGRTLFLTPARGTVITVTDRGDEGVLVEAGWTIKVLADCDADRFVPPQGLYVVEAIMDGYAEEATLATADGESWAGVSFRIRTPYGDIGDTDEQPKLGTRTLEPWARARNG